MTPVNEVVVCAAVVANNGSVFRCHRHSDGFMAIAFRGLEVLAGGEAQGFVTSCNRFVGRREALALQLAAGIKSMTTGGYRGDQLFSEDLY